MAYRITYSWQKEAKLSKKAALPFWKLLGLAALCGALLLRLLIPQSEQLFRELLHPLTDEYTVSAFVNMVEEIGDGTPVPEAVTSFCREIIAHEG